MKERSLTNWLRQKEGYSLITGHALSEAYDARLAEIQGRRTGHSHYSHSLVKKMDDRSSHVIGFLNLEKVRQGFSLREGKVVEVLGARIDKDGGLDATAIRAVDIVAFEKQLKAGRSPLEIFENAGEPSAPYRRIFFSPNPGSGPQIR
ncbi:MAG: hypothetical protein M3N08_06290 [Pseudomonadota bacterium]|nr:hypothetical protein [Pseudomonadota bacterium]